MGGAETVEFADQLLAWIDTWGYLAILGLMFAENLFLLGTIVPGESAVVVAGFAASRGALAPVSVVAVAALAAIAGANASYLLGRVVGVEGVRRWWARLSASRVGRLLRMRAESIVDIEAYFDRHGPTAVFLARFSLGANNVVPTLAGSLGMKTPLFEVYTVIGAAIDMTLLTTLGWILGDRLDAALRAASWAAWAGLGVLVAFIVSTWLVFKRAAERRAGR